MFTMKKLALVGAAGLAAFSISCSDTGDDDASGSWTKPFGIEDKGTSGIVLSGEITASGDALVSGVGLKAGDKDVTIDNQALLVGDVVSLDGSKVSGFCPGKSGKQTGVKFSITVTFTDQTKLTADKTIDVDCPVTGPALTGIVLSFADKSYFDADAGQTYKKSDIPSNDVIDLVAYYSGSAGDKIYTCAAAGLTGCSDMNVILVDAAMTNATAAEDWYYDSSDAEIAAAEEVSVTITVGKFFIVETEDSTFVVEITGKEDQAVSIAVTEI